MRTTFAALILVAVVACSSPAATEPLSPNDPVLNITSQARPVPSLVIERVSGDCTSGILVRVRGTNLSARSRFGNQWLSKSNLTSMTVQVVLGAGSKKSVEWETFWPAADINPASGGKFTGWAQGVITDSWTGIEHETGQTFIGPNCSAG